MSNHADEVECIAAAHEALSHLGLDARRRALTFLWDSLLDHRPPERIAADNVTALAERARALIKAQALVPPEVRFQQLVDSGLIDEDGRYTGPGSGPEASDE